VYRSVPNGMKIDPDIEHYEGLPQPEPMHDDAGAVRAFRQRAEASVPSRTSRIFLTLLDQYAGQTGEGLADAALALRDALAEANSAAEAALQVAGASSDGAWVLSAIADQICACVTEENSLGRVAANFLGAVAGALGIVSVGQQNSTQSDDFDIGSGSIWITEAIADASPILRCEKKSAKSDQVISETFNLAGATLAIEAATLSKDGDSKRAAVVTIASGLCWIGAAIFSARVAQFNEPASSPSNSER